MIDSCGSVQFSGELGEFGEHFRGRLAGLTLLKDRTESDRVIQCLNNCQESLDFTGLENMPSGTVSPVSYTLIYPSISATLAV